MSVKRREPSPEKTAPAKPAEPVLRVTSLEWDRWLAKHHASADAVVLTLSKRGAEPPTLSYAEAVEVALTWGWIDGHARSHDDERYWQQRYSRRRVRSSWSKINRAKAEALIESGRMHPPGLAEVERARGDGRWDAAYDSPRTSQVPADLAAALAQKPRAKAFFEQLDGANRYAVLYRVQTAKKPETRARRVETLVAMLTKHETIHPVRKRKAAARESRAALPKERKT